MIKSRKLRKSNPAACQGVRARGLSVVIQSVGAGCEGKG
jgi:hypothetical protein